MIKNLCTAILATPLFLTVASAQEGVPDVDVENLVLACSEGGASDIYTSSSPDIDKFISTRPDLTLTETISIGDGTATIYLFQPGDVVCTLLN